MTEAQSRYNPLYTAIACALVVGVVAVLSFTVIRNLVEFGTNTSLLVHLVVGGALLLLVDPMRKAMHHIAERFVFQRTLDTGSVSERLSSVFTGLEDSIVSCEQVQSILADTFHFESVEIVLRSREKFRRIGSGEMSTVSESLFTQPVFSKTTQVLYVHERSIQQDLRSAMNNSHAVASIPLTSRGTVFGWITCIQSSRRYRLFPHERDFLQHIQPLLSLGIQGVESSHQLRQHISELEMLNRLSQTMNSSLNVNETLEFVMDSIVELVQVERALLFLFSDDERQLHPTIARGMTSDLDLNYIIDVRKSIFQFAIRDKTPLIVEDALHDPRVNQQYLSHVKATSFVAVPLISRERVIGIIGADTVPSGRPVTDINLDLFVTLANHAAIAITNSTMVEQIRGFNHELQRKIEEATEDLHRLLEMKSHFLSVASHQLRTPTTIVKGLLSMIVEDPSMPVEEQRKMVKQAYASMNRLQRIISELLSATELEDASVKAYSEEMDPTVLVQGIIDELSPLAKDRGITLLLEASTDRIPTIHSDKFKLSEALNNLVDNAIRYTKKGSVTVHITHDGDIVSFHVQDTGIGIATEERAAIFEKFHRGARIAEVEPNGTGLGLFIAKRITDILHGTLSVHSDGVGLGSTFTITIPVQFSKD